MEKEDIEKFYEDEKRDAEKAYLNSTQENREQLYKDRMKRAREKYLQLYSQNMRGENKKLIEQIRQASKGKKEKSQKELEKKKKEKVKKNAGEVSKFRLSIRIKEISLKIVPASARYFIKKWGKIIGSEKTYFFLIISSWTARQYRKLLNKTKLMLLKIKEILQKIKEKIKKVLPKKKPGKAGEKKEVKEKS